jgi:hypothetical protein
VQGRWERGREQNERERVVGKAAGDECVFIPGEGPSWQMRSSDTIPDAAGGEGGHGVARPDGVIHRYRVYPVVHRAKRRSGSLPIIRIELMLF